jgi:hypothetical protein
LPWLNGAEAATSREDKIDQSRSQEAAPGTNGLRRSLILRTHLSATRKTLMPGGYRRRWDRPRHFVVQHHSRNLCRALRSWSFLKEYEQRPALVLALSDWAAPNRPPTDCCLKAGESGQDVKKLCDHNEALGFGEDVADGRASATCGLLITAQAETAPTGLVLLASKANLSS